MEFYNVNNTLPTLPFFYLPPPPRVKLLSNSLKIARNVDSLSVDKNGANDGVEKGGKRKEDSGHEE